jgi:hypothetical protein
VHGGAVGDPLKHFDGHTSCDRIRLDYACVAAIRSLPWQMARSACLAFVKRASAVAEGGAAVLPAPLDEVTPHIGDAFANALGLVLREGHVDMGWQVADHIVIGDNVDLSAKAGEFLAGSGDFGNVAAETIDTHNNHG